jgi:hypothetical protein
MNSASTLYRRDRRCHSLNACDVIVINTTTIGVGVNVVAVNYVATL